tara:strand:- start:1 stop:459 length:459 start_codon:yes stop_codon:yes gene_type:complete
MSELKKKLSEQLKTAMKAGDKETVQFARSLHAAVRKKEIDERIDCSDEDFQKIVSTSIKQRKDSIDQFQKGGREDLVAKEQAELDFLQSFLPPQLTDEELEKIVNATVDEVNPSSPKEMGKVMQAIMPKVQGRADGKRVSESVRKRVSEKTS